MNLCMGKSVYIWLYLYQCNQKWIISFWNACYRNSSGKLGLNFKIIYSIAERINQLEKQMWYWY